MIIHILKLIRSRMGGSGWILAELLVVFVVIWFMTSYFLMMGKSWYEPVGYDLEGVYHAVLAVRPSNSPSFVTYEEGGDEAARDVERIVERLRGHADVEAVALSVSSLPYTLSWSGSRVTRDSVSVSVRLMTSRRTTSVCLASVPPRAKARRGWARLCPGQGKAGIG